MLDNSFRADRYEQLLAGKFLPADPPADLDRTAWGELRQLQRDYTNPPGAIPAAVLRGLQDIMARVHLICDITLKGQPN